MLNGLILALKHMWKCPLFLTSILPVPEVILRGNAAYFFSVFYGIGGSGFASKIGFIKYSWQIFFHLILFGKWFYFLFSKHSKHKNNKTTSMCYKSYNVQMKNACLNFFFKQEYTFLWNWRLLSVLNLELIFKKV